MGGGDWMKPITFQDAPGWVFEIEEISAGVYRMRAHDEYGRSISMDGTDSDALLERSHHDATEMIRSDGKDAASSSFAG
jgi:hypothetical protein